METPDYNQELVLPKGRKSDVWKYFGFFKDIHSGNLDKSRVICTLCRRSFKYNTATSSTSSMVSHLTIAHAILSTTTTKTEEFIENINQIKSAPNMEGIEWQHFGFYDNTDGSDLDFSYAVCKICYTKLRYNSENTYNLRRHLQNYHDVDVPRAKRAIPEAEILPPVPEAADDRPLIDAQSIQKPRSQTYFAAYQHFGYFEKSDGSGELDESKIVCKICLHEYSNAGRFHADYYLDHLKKRHNFDPSVSNGSELTCLHNPLVKDLPGVPLFKSKVWQYFGFYPLPNSQEADRTKAVCKLCRREIDYVGSGVTVLFKHINKHGIDLQKDTKERRFPEDVGIFVEAHLTKGATARTTYYSPEWGYFGFYAYPLSDGQNTEVDKSRTVCKLCRHVLSFSGRIMFMSIHLHEVHGIVLHAPGKYVCCNPPRQPNTDTNESQSASDFASESTDLPCNSQGESSMDGNSSMLDSSHTSGNNTLDSGHSTVGEKLYDGKPLISMESVTHLKSTAKAWEYFGFSQTKDGKLNKTQVICRLCSKSLTYSSSTSNMNKHLAIKHTIDTKRPTPSANVNIEWHSAPGATGYGTGTHNTVQTLGESKFYPDLENNSELNESTQESDTSQTPGHKPYRKSKVWLYFQFNTTQEGGLDKTRVVCKKCKTELSYCGNTSNMAFHLKRYHKIETIANRFCEKAARQSTPQEHAGENSAQICEESFEQAEPDESYDSDTELILTDCDVPKILNDQVEKTKSTVDVGVRSSRTISPYKSKVWKYFDKVHTGQSNRKRVLCNLCGSEYTYYGNTSNMSYHLQRFHNIDIRQESDDIELKPSATNTSQNETEPNSTVDGEQSSETDSKNNMQEYVKSIINKLSDKDASPSISKTSLNTPKSTVKFKSKVWNHFDFYRSPEGIVSRTKVVCLHCNHELIYTSSTKSMMNHLERRHDITVPRLTSHLEKSRVWQHMEFRECDDGTIDKSKAFCRLCDHEFNYDGSTSGMMKHLMRKHRIDSRSSNSPQKPTNNLCSTRSKVWDYFSLAKFADGTPNRSQVICSICDVMLKYKSSTTNMLGHLMRVHNLNALKMKQAELQAAKEHLVKQERTDEISVESKRIDKSKLTGNYDSNYTEEEVSQIWQHFGKFEEGGTIDETKVICQICYVKVKYYGTLRHMTKHLYSDHDIDIKQSPSNVTVVRIPKREHDSDHEFASGNTDSDVEFQSGEGITSIPLTKRPRTAKHAQYYRDDSPSSNDGEQTKTAEADNSEIECMMEDFDTSAEKEIYDAQVVLNLSRLSATIWKYFGFYKSETNPNKYEKAYAICKLCRAPIRYASSTKLFYYHLSKHGIKVKGDSNFSPKKITKTSSKSAQVIIRDSDKLSVAKSNQIESELIEIMDDFMDSTENDVKFEQSNNLDFESQSIGNQTQITDSIARFVCKDLQSLDTFNSVAFQNLIQALAPTYEMPPKSFFVDTIIEGLYDETKQKIIECLQNIDGLALTGYQWKYRDNRSCMTISSHVITSNWAWKTFVLSTVELPDRGLEDAAMSALEEALQCWKQPRNQRHAFVCDLSNLQQTDHVASYNADCDQKALFIPCFGQSINVAVIAGLQSAKAVEVLSKVRTLVALLRASDHLDVSDPEWKGLEIDQSEQLWKSTLAMIEFVTEHSNAINSVVFRSAAIPPSNVLDKDENAIVRDMIETLSPIKKMTELICEIENPSLSLLAPLLNQLIASLKTKNGESEFVQSLKNAIREKLSSSYGSEIMSKAHVAAALDPRFKSLIFLTHEHRSQIFDQVLKDAVDIQTVHPLSYSDTSLTLDMDVQTIQDEPVPENSSPADIQQKVISSSTSALSNLFGEIFQNSSLERTTKTPEEKVQCELVKYQNSDMLGMEGNALQWWRMHDYELPLLARLAKCYVTIPLLSMKACHLFSNSKRDLVYRSNVIDENDLDKQLFLESNL